MVLVELSEEKLAIEWELEWVVAQELGYLSCFFHRKDHTFQDR